ncbi:hypothetical protein [Streptomyces goshikiensis]|uniref:hypothetical protein n=1 Tax=Streptomyces goshikiensis TaxID=1942 RepID=UPI003687FCAD
MSAALLPARRRRRLLRPSDREGYGAVEAMAQCGWQPALFTFVPVIPPVTQPA